MIRTALLHIQERINQHFRNEFSKDENMLVLSNLANADGSVPNKVENKIVFFLVGIAEESTMKNNLNRVMSGNSDSFSKTSPALHFNMQLLFCANFAGIPGYEEGLAYLSSLIRFFQTNRTMNIPGSPLDLSKDSVSTGRNKEDDTTNSSGRTQRISFELCKLDYSELSHLWSAIGSKLMPSVLYKVGMVVFDNAPMGRIFPAIKDTKSQI